VSLLGASISLPAQPKQVSTPQLLSSPIAEAVVIQDAVQRQIS